MACPFFLPVTRLDQNGWIHAPRLPLGDPYGGTCHTRPGEPFEPPDSSLHDLCNCGYARGRCDRFPVDRAADAVRFSVIAVEPDLIRLVYVLEKSHAPVEHGALTYAIGESHFVDAPPNLILAAQAQAFLEGFLERRALRAIA